VRVECQQLRRREAALEHAQRLIWGHQWTHVAPIHIPYSGRSGPKEGERPRAPPAA
jgi:hypothetical protein